jgi:hypothetical protein
LFDFEMDEEDKTEDQSLPSQILKGIQAAVRWLLGFPLFVCLSENLGNIVASFEIDLIS